MKFTSELRDGQSHNYHKKQTAEFFLDHLIVFFMRNRFDGMFSGLVDLVDGLRTLSLQQSAKVIERNLSRLLKSVYGPGGDS